MKQYQQGAVLIVSLIFLLILTLLGFSASQSVQMQEKMTYSAQDAQVALEAAEAAIDAAKVFIESSVTTTVDFVAAGNSVGNPGLYSQGNAPVNMFDSANWTNANSRAVDTQVAAGVGGARYIIENMGMVDIGTGSAAQVTMKGYGETTGSGNVNAFRIIARGVGRTANTERIVVLFYGKLL